MLVVIHNLPGKQHSIRNHEMTKKVSFNEIEILTGEGDSSARRLLGMVESVIDRLRSDLGPADENFRVSIDMQVAPNRPIRNSVSIRSFSNHGAKGKVMKILEKSTGPHSANVSGTVRVDLQVEDI
jgi:hypothetical protein